MIIKPYEPDHLRQLILQPAQAFMQDAMSEVEYQQILAGMESYTCIMNDRVVACCGILPMWKGRAMMWALIASDLGHIGMLKLHRAVERSLKLYEHIRRLEVYVSCDFEQAHRWMKLLGFKNETPEGMAGFTPDGKPCCLYSRVING